jgi:glycosyltransferase 2 family protein
LGFISVALDRGLGLIGNNILGALGLILGGIMIAPVGSVAWLVGSGCNDRWGGIGEPLMLGSARTRVWIQKILVKARYAGSDARTENRAWLADRTCLNWRISISTHMIALTAFWCCLQAFGTTAPFSALMVGLPALGLLMMLPISISGWGLREATLSTTPSHSGV